MFLFEDHPEPGNTLHEYMDPDMIMK